MINRIKLVILSLGISSLDFTNWKIFIDKLRTSVTFDSLNVILLCVSDNCTITSKWRMGVAGMTC